MEEPASNSDSNPGDGCSERSFSALTVDDVYRIAKQIGAEVEKLIDGYGKESVVGLVPKVVKVLELLESFASRNDAHKQREEELLKTFESIQLQQQQKKRVKEGEDAADQRDKRVLQEKEEQCRRRCEELLVQVQQLQVDKEQLQRQLKGTHTHDDRVQRQEREVMLKLKEVVDKQRDELRAKAQEISSASREVEALQEQLERFMKMNAELRHRQSVLQTQLKSTVERKADMEADLKEQSKAMERLQAQLDRSSSNRPQMSPAPPETAASPDEPNDADTPCFTKKEVRDILFERNELKTNLFLVQEELNYYQREILSEERCPGFLLEAVRSAITKRRKVIKEKMLGIQVTDCISDEDEEQGSLLGGSTEVDGLQKPAESRIRNLFGFLTRSGSSRSPTHLPASASTWEIIGDLEVEPDPPS
ncbi:RILP-like protein 1 isoform X1 [Synchiropus splendidus]|uniref:RILP-like protein 1 isoform X1 n=1 Tax=Synchiropus splendidus TaxID=270530 RepID=UPI00237DE89E|nr:RILP-like protein 1 isoform X1 [Synchiropus splendidus]